MPLEDRLPLPRKMVLTGLPPPKKPSSLPILELPMINMLSVHKRPAVTAAGSAVISLPGLPKSISAPQLRTRTRDASSRGVDGASKVDAWAPAFAPPALTRKQSEKQAKLERRATEAKLRSPGSEAEPALTSELTVTIIFDIFRANLAAHDAAARAAAQPGARPPFPQPPSLLEVTTRHVKSLNSCSGIIDLRIGCVECAPHPMVKLFQQLLSWVDSPRALTAAQLSSLWLMQRWLLPSKARFAGAILDQKRLKMAEAGPRIGTGSEDLLPPRAFVPFEAVPKMLRLLRARKLLEPDGVAASQLLLDAAKDLRERREGSWVVDVDELLLFWMELWGDWHVAFDAPLTERPRRVPVRKPEKGKVQVLTLSPEARARRAAASTFADSTLGDISDGGDALSPATSPSKGADGEGFATGMRQNAMEMDVSDADGNRALDFDEFVSFIQLREKGPHSGFELRARFDALDTNKNGRIDLRELIRFSLRDALKRSAARVIDLLREWDADGNGVISRKEFRRAIEALGFASMARPKDINELFSEFDTSGDGSIEFRELAKMLRASAAIDAKMIGSVEGRAAVRSEARAELQRADDKKGGSSALEALSGQLSAQEQKAARSSEVLALLREHVQSSPARVLALFRDIDKSGDGLVDKREFKLAMRALGLNLAKPELGALFKELDIDKSGYVEYPELRSILLDEPFSE